MNVLLYISNLAIPFVVFYFVGMGIAYKNNVYEDFINGAKDGLKTVLTVMPTLIGLMVGVGVLSSSGFMEFIVKNSGKILSKVGFPPAVLPAVIIRLFSSSAATGLVLEVFKEFGADSYEGVMSSIIMSSTETCFYTMSVYFMAAKVSKGRWTLAGALISSFAGVVASIILTNMVM